MYKVYLTSRRFTLRNKMHYFLCGSGGAQSRENVSSGNTCVAQLSGDKLLKSRTMYHLLTDTLTRQGGSKERGLTEMLHYGKCRIRSF